MIQQLHLYIIDSKHLSSTSDIHNRNPLKDLRKSIEYMKKTIRKETNKKLSIMKVNGTNKCFAVSNARKSLSNMCSS